jgi:spore germination protein KC
MAITKVKELNSDIFGFGDAVHQRYRDEWKELEANWDEIFPDIEVEVTVESKLRRSGRITSPPIPEKE